MDHCRIGSLEKQEYEGLTEQIDHCRIGSLEISTQSYWVNNADHCRIGSLENVSVVVPSHASRSLPHRQLRKVTIPLVLTVTLITAA